ncbi:MAG: EAL domain-containing protein [bacterium]|nr:EAL domain-containing protein [bacterium]
MKKDIGTDSSGQFSKEELENALAEEQFTVWLQPKYNLATEEVCGAEALVRWQRNKTQIICPEQFIADMEKDNLLSELDYFVWEKTCQIIHDWFQAGKLPYAISVNVSTASLMNGQLVSFLVGLISKYGISPSFLQLEITENAYLHAPEHVENVIKSLHDIGFSVIMDDFGSGYSSLNTLKRIQIDALKLDMKYLPIKDRTENDEIILVSVIKMANWLGMSVIAEGVETRRQKDFLQGAGCDSVQGHFFSEAMSLEEYEARYVYHTTVVKETTSIDNNGIVPKFNMTILVIDDDEMSREILQYIFQELYHVHMCGSAEEGLAYLKRNANRVKLILTDNFMPGMSGMEFLRHCKQDQVLKVIPQIMITTSDETSDQLEAFRAGAYDYITKPFVREIVMTRVMHIMEISCRTSIFDIIEQKYKQKPELDAATSLLNKVAFSDLSNRIIETFPNEQQALFVIDIDDFKKVNDVHGHLIGDQIIRCVADELTNAFRKTDLIGRFGGDEFVVLATKIQSQDTAKNKAAEIIKNIMFSSVKQFNINTSISVGLAFSEKKDTLNTLFSRADKALYDAKNTGKGKTVVYGESIPPITDDDKPVILICSEDEQVYSTIALSYGEGAGFIRIENVNQLEQAFKQYHSRIVTACIDMQKDIPPEMEFFQQFLLQKSKGGGIPLVAICREGDMRNLKAALEFPIYDVMVIPPPIGSIERILSRAIMEVGIHER